MADVLVLGRMFPENTQESVLNKSRAMIQTSAHAHLSKILCGLDKVCDVPVSVINVIPVGSYPKRYDDLFIDEFTYSHTNGASDINIGFCNLTVWKKVSMKRALHEKVLQWAKNGKDDKIVIAYTCCSLFLSACSQIKKLVPNCRVCVIVPDLPAYTDLDKDGKWIYRMATSYRVKSINRKIAVADSFVFLTDAMKDAFSVKRPYIVMEGIADEVRTDALYEDDGLKYIVYTGTFTKKYGIMKLVDAFMEIKDAAYRLLLCGSGEACEEIKHLLQADNRIVYLGMLSREETSVLQRKATVLVNPRTNDHDYTAYSFPSKIMEYLSSGRPVICFKLDGIPDEYDKYLKYFKDDTPTVMAQDLISMCQMDAQSLNDIGIRGQVYVQQEKNAVNQVSKMMDMIQKPRLLFVGNTLDIGGTTTSLLSLLHSMDDERYNIDCIFARNKGEGLADIPPYVRLLPPALEENRPKLDKLKKAFLYTLYGYLPRAFLYKWFGKYALGKFQILSGMARSSVSRSDCNYYDIVIGYMEGFADWYAAKNVMAGRKIAFVHVNYEQAGLDPMLDKGLWEHFERIALVSEDSRESFDRVFTQFADKTCVIENILSKELLISRSDQTVSDFLRKPNTVHIMTAARLVNRHKGIDRAVRITSRLINDGYMVDWSVFGEGEDRTELEELIFSMNMEDNFHLMGNRSCVQPYIKQADLFVMTSYYEGKPMAVTEAMLLGVPVIVSEYASAREQVDDGVTGIVCGNNEEAIYAAIKRVLDDISIISQIKENLREYKDVGDVEAFYRLFEGR